VFENSKLLSALFVTGAIAAWGIFDNAGLAVFANKLVSAQFTSRA